MKWNKRQQQQNHLGFFFSFLFLLHTHASCFLIRNIFTSGGIFSHSFHFGLSIEVQKRTRIPFNIFEQRVMWYACKLYIYIHRRHSVSAYLVCMKRTRNEKHLSKLKGRRKVMCSGFNFSLLFAHSLFVRSISLWHIAIAFWACTEWLNVCTGWARHCG